MNSVCIISYNRFDYFRQTYEDVVKNCVQPYEVIVVDDHSTDKLLVEYLKQLEVENKIRLHINDVNRGACYSQNKAMDMASKTSNCLIHLENDIVVGYYGWNKIFEEYLVKYPEIGLIAPLGTGRDCYIQRPGYREYTWALGGVWGIRRELYDKIGGWDESLLHQRECDYCLRVRMEGYRVAEVNEFTRGIHLGEGYEQETESRKKEIAIGVYNFLKKWNKRFIGWYDFKSPYVMVWQTFPPNVFFRHLAYAEAYKELNKDKKRLNVGGPWYYDLITILYERSRLDPDQLYEDVKNNKWFKDYGNILDVYNSVDILNEENNYDWKTEVSKVSNIKNSDDKS